MVRELIKLRRNNNKDNNNNDDHVGCDVGRVGHLLDNLLAYYRQFSQSCRDRVASLRAGVEKELKNLVKISRWNDRNFFANVAATKK